MPLRRDCLTMNQADLPRQSLLVSAHATTIIRHVLPLSKTTTKEDIRQVLFKPKPSMPLRAMDGYVSWRIAIRLCQGGHGEILDALFVPKVRNHVHASLPGYGQIVLVVKTWNTFGRSPHRSVWKHSTSRVCPCYMYCYQNDSHFTVRACIQFYALARPRHKRDFRH